MVNILQQLSWLWFTHPLPHTRQCFIENWNIISSYVYVSDFWCNWKSGKEKENYRTRVPRCENRCGFKFWGAHCDRDFSEINTPVVITNAVVHKFFGNKELNATSMTRVEVSELKVIYVSQIKWSILKWDVGGNLKQSQIQRIIKMSLKFINIKCLNSYCLYTT